MRKCKFLSLLLTLAAGFKDIRLIIVVAFILLTVSCTKSSTELSGPCKQLVESDSFYHVVPLANTWVTQTDTIWKLDNFLSTSNDPEIQTFDTDCIVTINPTNEKLDELRKALEDNFNETISISTKHTAAIKCVTESHGINFFEATGQLVRFKTTNQTWDLDMQKDKIADWKFILFKKGKEPKIIPSIQMTFEEIDKYFALKSGT